MRNALVASLLLVASLEASAQGLTGTKTIGAGGDYPTIVDAVAALNANGVGVEGVTFDIVPGDYSGNVHLNPPGEARRVVFRKAPSASDPVIVRANSGDTVWTIEGTHVTEMTLQGLTIVATDQTGVRLLSNSASLITLQQCEIRLSSSTSGTGPYFAYRCHSIQNRSILRRNAIVVDSSNAWCHGIMTQGSVTLDGNRIQGTGNRALTGLWLRDNKQTPMTLVNNLVVGFLQPLIVQDTGLTANAYHNTFLGTGNAIFLVNVIRGAVEFKNNLCSAPGGSCLSLQESSALVSDHNLYWANSMGSFNGSSCETLEDWRWFSGQDGHSLAEDPKLTPAASPEVDSPCVNVGLPGLASTDIDGHSRPIGIGADIGAHEVMHAAPIDLSVLGSTSSPQFQARFVAPPTSNSARCRVQVAADSAFASVIWDSMPSWSDTAPRAANMVSVWGGQLSSLTYAGPALQEETTYFWRVRFWDDTYSIPTRWSETSSFTTGAAPAVPEEESSGTGSTSVEGPEPAVSPLAPDPETSVIVVVDDHAPEEDPETGAPSAPGSGGGSCGLVGLEALLLLTLLSLRRRKSALAR